MDCSWGFGNGGCRGGLSWKALVWARKFGIASSKTYGRYLAQVGHLFYRKKILYSLFLYLPILSKVEISLYVGRRQLPMLLRDYDLLNCHWLRRIQFSQ